MKVIGPVQCRSTGGFRTALVTTASVFLIASGGTPLLAQGSGTSSPGSGTSAPGSGTSSESAPPPAASPATQAGSDPVANWPEPSRKAAKEMMDKYGKPAGVTPMMLVWNQTGPWKKIVVHKEPVDHKFPKPHEDVLEQTINYKVPPDKYDELAQFDGSVVARRTEGEMSAMCDKEAMNFLALNLAHEVATGKKSVEEARSEYAKQAMAFMKKESAPYTEKLLFDTPANSGNPDEPAPGMAPN